MLMAKSFADAVVIGCVTWLRVFGFERCGSVEEGLSAR